MADPTKHLPLGGGGPFLSELKTLLGASRRTAAFAYGFMFAFVALTVFLLFNPSPNSSSPWLSGVFTSASTADSYRSHFSSLFSYFFPNSSSSSSPPLPLAPNFFPPPPRPSPPDSPPRSANATVSQPPPVKNHIEVPDISTVSLTNETSNSNSSTQVSPNSASKPRAANRTPANQTRSSPGPSSSPTPPAKKNDTAKAVKSGPADKVIASNYTASLSKRDSNSNKTVPVPAPVPAAPQGKGTDRLEPLEKCDFFDGQWVMDDSYPLYKPGSCSLIDEQFNCVLNGRPDRDYHKFRWKPKGCDLPRLDGSRMLEMLRGKRLVFVGDSLNRNMWESLVCILRNSAKDRKNVYEANGRQHFRGEASYSFIFKDYNCTVEFFVSPFLVREWEMPDKNGTKKDTLRLDLVGRSCDQYKGADVIVFNTGHWWTHEKTSKGKDYYQEGSHVYSELNVLEAFRKALTTWARWVDANVNPMKSLVFFRGYSASHFSGGQWNSGGQCDSETQPIKNDTYLREYPPKMTVLESVLKGMKTHVTYLNITLMTDYRKDGHPSIYRKRHLTDAERRSPLMFQDCSHWCLPGVPDAWNEILYAELLVKLNQKDQQQQQQKRP
ncbi:protein trichome birefringence-like [Punica granatum]|uniref:Uncharacterized protein n=2 Tax=Punica granatum TaxID=22663 RepID=A0A218XCH8_PUNGR|nr:protein trichome birefringence-like [Punica granatum]OWM82643.1 hypothetical protein CDL15_Pgr002218 [Punica granatum]PKI54172.1 hypothetical protein CRG98_025405 [Punica granatum]